MFIVIIN